MIICRTVLRFGMGKPWNGPRSFPRRLRILVLDTCTITSPFQPRPRTLRMQDLSTRLPSLKSVSVSILAFDIVSDKVIQSHFTEIKYGLISGEQGTTDNLLRWDVNSATQWSTQLVADTWYNFAYDIDFSGNTVALWQSTGSDPLVQVVAPVSASTSTNSEDWHIGQLRLPNGGTNAAAEDWFWSGIFIEEGPITTDIAGPFPGQGGAAGSQAPPPPTSAPASTSSVAVPVSTVSSSTPTSSASGPAQTQWGQCGGTGFTYVFIL